MSKTRLILDNRINLQATINKNYSLEECAILLKKSRSTIYKEMVNNCYYKQCRHTCSHRSKSCPILKPFVNGECKEFHAYRCEKWNKFPYTCNGCKDTQFCTHLKRYHDCIEAEETSKRKRIEPRVYSKISNKDMAAMDEELIHGIRDNGQSLHHLYVSSKLLQSTCCERTIRRYIYKSYMTVNAHELPRYVRYSHKYDYTKKKIVNIERMLGRTYSDFVNYVKENPQCNVWEYDSVIGKLEDKKAILTITFPDTRFQFGFLITKESSRSVNSKIRNLQSKLGNLYKKNIRSKFVR